MYVLPEHALQTKDCSDVEPLLEERLTDKEYTDDVVLFSDDAAKLQRLLDHLTELERMFRMPFVPSGCMIQDVQNLTDSASSFTLNYETRSSGKFTYWDSIISSGGF